MSGHQRRKQYPPYSYPYQSPGNSYPQQEQYGYPSQYASQRYSSQYYDPNEYQQHQQSGGYVPFAARPAAPAYQYTQEYGTSSVQDLSQQMAMAQLTHPEASRAVHHGSFSHSPLSGEAAPPHWNSHHSSAASPTTRLSVPSHEPSLSNGQSPGQSAGAESRSSLSLRYPPLPEVPLCCPPPEQADVDDNKSLREYIDSLKAVIKVYEQRDDILRLRIEATGFDPKQAWLAWNGSRNADLDATQAQKSEAAHPILGVRLLQRVDQLTRENEELGQALEERIDERESELASARSEVTDCHRLIQSLDQALTQAELRASAADRALEVACASNSTSIVTSLPHTDPPDSECTVANSGATRTSVVKKPQNDRSAPRWTNNIHSDGTKNGRGGGSRNRGPAATSLPPHPNPRPSRRPASHTHPTTPTT